MINKLGVIGAGYVGLVSAACFADLGFKVCVVDYDTQKIDALKNAIIPIHEPQLAELVKKSINNNHLTFSESYNDIEDCCAVIMTVGTPSNDDGSANLDYLYSATRELMNVAKDGCVIILKSTVPIGTAKNIMKLVPDTKHFHIVNNPEFLREGNAIYDFQNPDRIVIGMSSDEPKAIISYLYSHFIKQDVPILFTDNTTAETIKYASNSYLAMRIAFINEITTLCETSGANISDTAEGMGMDARIGKHYLHPGPGFGGSCFPKDTKALSYFATSNELDLPIIQNIMHSNLNRIEDLIEKLHSTFSSNQCKNIAVLGLTFKANTDDMRDSPAIPIVKALLKNGYSLKFYDPSHTTQIKEYLDITLQNSIDEALDGADAAVILTEWSEFQLISPQKFEHSLNKKVIYDMRNILNSEVILKQGLKYFALGFSPSTL